MRKKRKVRKRRRGSRSAGCGDGLRKLGALIDLGKFSEGGERRKGEGVINLLGVSGIGLREIGGLRRT